MSNIVPHDKTDFLDLTAAATQGCARLPHDTRIKNGAMHTFLRETAAALDDCSKLRKLHAAIGASNIAIALNTSAEVAAAGREALATGTNKPMNEPETQPFRSGVRTRNGCSFTPGGAH
jgi:hypothetical protein